MAFQIKTFTAIVASMLNHARATTTKITDWSIGSGARTLVEAPAIEIEELYIQFFNGLREAIPVATFNSFNFTKLPKAYAHGFVTVVADTPPADNETYPIGTEFLTEDGRSYLSTDAVTWVAEEDSARFPVSAAAAGLAYNVSAGAINSSPVFGAGYSVSNATIANGRDDETDEERSARFAEFVASLSGSSVVACMYKAKSATVLDDDGNIYEYVTRIGIKEDPGYVKYYIYSSAGAPSDELLANAQRLIDGWRDELTGARNPGARAGGVRVDVLPMIERAVDFSASIGMLAGYSLTAGVIQDLEGVYADALASTEAGDVLRIGNLEADLLTVTGVRSVVPDATSNIVCDVFEVLVPGAVTFTPL